MHGIVACVNAVVACVNASGFAFTTLAVAGVGDSLGCMHALFACGLPDGRRGREHVYAGYHSV